MRGELGPIWPFSWKEIWVPLMQHPEYGDDLIIDLFREHVAAPVPVPAVDQMSAAAFEKFQAELRRYEETTASVTLAKAALRREIFSKPVTEAFALRFLEDSYGIFEGYDDGNFANDFYNRVDRFLTRYSLRYDLRRPLTLHPTLSGIFTALIRELDRVAKQDAHLQQLLSEFEEAIRDLRNDLSQGRVKTCIQKQFNLLEAIGRTFPGVTQQTLGDICGQINSWPHATVREALKRLYGFRSDYPGLGHGGNPAGVLRELDARDMVAIGVMLAGFIPYLSDGLDARLIYEG